MRFTVISITLLLALTACKASQSPADTEKKSDTSPVSHEQAVAANNQAKVDTFFDY